MKDTLIQAGLSSAQAEVYLLLLDKGALAPPAIASALGLTRSNAYKVLEQLMKMDMVTRSEKHKKFMYAASNPNVLNDMLAHDRKRLQEREKAVHSSLQALHTKYQQQAPTVETKTYRGKNKLERLYERQAERRQPIYFIKSRADIPAMGFETMDRLRKLPQKYQTPRYGITPQVPEGIVGARGDQRTNLTRTWVDKDSYTSPVEWSVSGDEITIYAFTQDGAGVIIKNDVIAESFREIWKILDEQLRKQP